MSEKLVLGIDLGGSKLAYKLVRGESILTNFMTQTNYDFKKQLTNLYKSLCEEFGYINTVSIGVPGPVSNGVMGISFPLNTTSDTNFNNVFPNADRTIIRNDMQMAAYAELLVGEGHNYKNFCIISLSTGIGLGVVVDRTVLNIRCEMGHQIIMSNESKEWPCIGHKSCWASICSGRAILENGFLPKDYPFLREVNSTAFANIVCAYDPEIIFVMGGVGIGLFDEIIPRKSDLFEKTNLRPIPDIKLSLIRNDIGVSGAIALASVTN